MLARAISDQERALISSSTLWHYTNPKGLDKIMITAPKGQNRHQVFLKAFQGWSPNPFKFFRDITIWDPDFTSANYGKYVFFFLGKARTAETAFLKTQGLTSSIEISGQDLLRLCTGRVFFRASDRAVIIRGGYEGPAVVTR